MKAFEKLASSVLDERVVQHALDEAKAQALVWGHPDWDWSRISEEKDDEDLGLTWPDKTDWLRVHEGEAVAKMVSFVTTAWDEDRALERYRQGDIGWSTVAVHEVRFVRCYEKKGLVISAQHEDNFLLDMKTIFCSA